MPKSARKKTGGRAIGEKEWNGTTRFQAIAPVYGRIMQLRQAEAMAYAPAKDLVLAAASQQEIQSLISEAAKTSGASEAQIESWVDAFTSLGRPGLMNDIPLTASDCAANLHGTWDLISRFSGGVETACRSRMYCDMDPEKARGTTLITMWTEENLFKRRGNETLFFIGLTEIEFKQNGPTEVIGNSRGLTFGNSPDYEKGVETRDSFRLVRKGNNETMLGVPRRSESGPGSDSAARFLVEVGGDPGTIKFKMWGVPATADHPATLDTVDTYTIMSNRRPVIGGWELITDYFTRMTKATIGGSVAQLKGKTGPSLQLVPGTRQSLRRACEHVPIPLGSRQS
jgi:hypothetical protein